MCPDVFDTPKADAVIGRNTDHIAIPLALGRQGCDSRNTTSVNRGGYRPWYVESRPPGRLFRFQGSRVPGPFPYLSTSTCLSARPLRMFGRQRNDAVEIGSQRFMTLTPFISVDLFLFRRYGTVCKEGEAVWHVCAAQVTLVFR